MAETTDPHLMNDTKCIINSLVIPYPKGLTLRKLCIEYRDQEGRDIPYRELGYPSLTALLKCMPEIRMSGNLMDIHSVVLFPVANELTKHIIDLVKCQNKSKEKGPPLLSRSRSNYGQYGGGGGGSGGYRAPRFMANKVVNYGAGRGAPPTRTRFHSSIGLPLVNGLTPRGPPMNPIPRPMNPTGVRPVVNTLTNKFQNFSITRPTAQIPNPPSTRPFIPMPTAMSIPLKSEQKQAPPTPPTPTPPPTPSPQPEPPKPVAQVTTQPPPQRTVTIIPAKPAQQPTQPKAPVTNGWSVSAKELPLPKVTDPNYMYRLRAIQDQIQARVIRVIEDHMPSGVALTDFLVKYRTKYDEIDLTRLRFADIREFFSLLSTQLPIVVKLIDGINRAFLKDREEVRDWVAQQCRNQRYIFPIVLVDTIADVVLPGELYKPIIPPAKFQPGTNEYVATYIASAVNPQEIFLQFKGQDYHSSLERMMMDLEFYDTAPVEKWSVPYEFLVVGLPVVTRYPGDKFWHRARISRIYPNQKRAVNVMFVDYGGLTVTDYTNLRLMRRDFLNTPVQAFKVGLYGIKPVLGDIGWAETARDKVLRFSKPNYPLATTLIEYQKGIPMVAICDTNTKDDVFIHNVLVNDNHAIFDDKAMEPNTTEDNISR